VPLAFQHLGWLKSLEPFDIDLRGHYALWIALGHAVQYLWVTAYYARAAADWGGYWSYFGKVLAAGTAIWTLPYLVFGRGTFGPLSVDAGLLMLVAAAINIHHFILDGAIWKLRNMRIASVLLRPTTATSAAAAGGVPMAPSWGRRLVWHTAIAGLAVGVFAFWQENVSYLSAFMRGDFARASAALDQLGWVGKESSTARIAVAMQLLRRGDLDGARQQAARSIALRETTDGYVLTGMIEERAQDTREALAAYQHALAIDPNRRDALIRAGTLQQALGENAQAQALLDRAASLSAQEQQPDRGPDRY
jgi:tetratricopeptide (TPR) repeat protein